MSPLPPDYPQKIAGGGSAASPRIPDYQLLRLIGQGSYGDVWLARGVTGVLRAIKVVWRARFTDTAPFEREFKGLTEFAAISLEESVQMALLHVGRNDEAGFFYYVMELADDASRGRDIDPGAYVPLTLTELRNRRGRLPAAEAIRVGSELARVLAGLHRRGLVHRDIKPSNVILVGGVPKLADIGLISPAGAALTFVGTEGFVPPEGPGASTADVFALGKLLYELATGMDRQEFPQLPPDLQRLPDRALLLELNEVILRACDPVPAERYRDGAAMHTDLVALQAGSSVRRRRRGKMIVRSAVVMVLVGALLAGGIYWAKRGSVLPAQVSADSTAEKTVAVLAFTNLSDDKDNEYFSDGVSEELLTVLQKIPGVRVSARTSAFSFKGKNVTAAEIGRTLGVAYLVEGSVRKVGTQVRVTSRLSRTDNGALLWSDSYTRELKDVLLLQAELAQTIVEQLRGKLGPAKAEAVAAVRHAQKGGTGNAEAFRLYLQGRFLLNRFTETNFADAVGRFRQALELDPEFALCWASLAWTYAKQAEYSLGGRSERELFSEARKAAERSLALEAELPEGYAALAEVQLAYDLDLKSAGRSALRALELAPTEATNLSNAARLKLWHGQINEGLALAQEAVALDPLNADVRRTLGIAYFASGRIADGETETRRLIEISPDTLGVYADLAGAYLRVGRFEEALAAAKKEKLEYQRITLSALALWSLGQKEESIALREEVMSRFPNTCAFQVGQIYAYQGNNDEAFKWFDRAFAQHDPGLASVRLCSTLEGIRGDPRWQKLFERLGVADW